jgi:hypothetical protein
MLLIGAHCVGCGTTKWTDTSRTATEQLLLTDSMDRAVSRVDFRAIAGKCVFIDETPVKNVVDAPYLVSSLRQHLLASGGILREKRDEADYVIEVRAGAVGTDRHDLLFGVPAFTLPTAGVAGAAPAQIPEISLVKRTNQRAVAKIALFVYNRHTGRPVWQSGIVPEESKAKAVWVFGAGPFQHGSIYDGTKFAGDHVTIPLIDPANKEEKRGVSVADEAFFVEPVDLGRNPAGIAGQIESSIRPPDDPFAAFGPIRQTSHLVDVYPAPSPGSDPGVQAPSGPAPTVANPAGPRDQKTAGQEAPPGGTSGDNGLTVPAINLPGQLPFGVNTPWSSEAGRVQPLPSISSDGLHFNPLPALHR